MMWCYGLHDRIVYADRSAAIALCMHAQRQAQHATQALTAAGDGPRMQGWREQGAAIAADDSDDDSDDDNIEDNNVGHCVPVQKMLCVWCVSVQVQHVHTCPRLHAGEEGNDKADDKEEDGGGGSS
jgi:hypothetical protein